MSQRRRLKAGPHDPDFMRSFRVVVVAPHWQTVLGPYATKSAAKGMVTREKRHYPEAEVYIEQTPEGWERVEL